MTDAVFTIDPSYRFTYLNSSAARTLGDRDQLLGTVVWDAFPELRESPFHQAYTQAFAEQRHVHAEAFAPSFNSWFEMDAYPGASDQLTVFFRPCSDRRRQQLHDELTTRLREVTAGVDQPMAALTAAARLLRAETDDEAASVWLVDHTTSPRLVSRDHDDPL